MKGPVSEKGLNRQDCGNDADGPVNVSRSPMPPQVEAEEGPGWGVGEVGEGHGAGTKFEEIGEAASDRELRTSRSQFWLVFLPMKSINSFARSWLRNSSSLSFR